MDDLVVLTRDPLNAETPLARQVGSITPVAQHYVRSHFAAPAAPGSIAFDGRVEAPFSIAAEELRSLPARSLIVTLECAGNGRSFLEPPAPGEQWGLGAVGTAEWTGVPLADLLARAKPLPDAKEIVFRGADRGEPKGLGQTIAFERSLSLEQAMRAEAILAYAMNGQPLTPDHGAPVRLVVPGVYGMASVKWLSEVTAVADEFNGFFQRDRYVIEGKPLGAIEPRAVVVEPVAGSHLELGANLIRGYAWSGRESIAGVDISTDGGRTWRAAKLAPAVSAYAWREWHYQWDALRGEASLIAIAVTRTGERQPLTAVRNELGYSNTTPQPVRVRVG